MNEINSTAVIAAWVKIKEAQGKSAFVENFYQYIFKHHPETLQLFSEDLELQKTKLITTLDNVINGIDYLENIEDVLIELGEHHKNINVTKEMYDHFITAVVTAAEISSDDTITKDELIAWKKAFRIVSDIMLRAY